MDEEAGLLEKQPGNGGLVRPQRLALAPGAVPENPKFEPGSGDCVKRKHACKAALTFSKDPGTFRAIFLLKHVSGMTSQLVSCDKESCVSGSAAVLLALALFW